MVFPLLIPELIVLAGAVTCAIVGVSSKRSVRDALPGVAIVTLVITGLWISIFAGVEGMRAPGSTLQTLGPWVGVVTCALGVVLVLLNAGTADREYESAVAAGKVTFDPLRTTRGEFYVFLLLSLGGLLLVTAASDLIWLFLALELTSLPTYVMVAMSRTQGRAQEAAMKYFFLGAMSAALFLYGFALLYGATGTVELASMQAVFTQQAAAGGIGVMGIAGMLLAVLGIGFKLAAAPMHLYAADVYEGAASPVTAFLGFVPKAAGALALMLLLSTIGWFDNGALPPVLSVLLWVMAALTMTLGNIGALLQTSAKRMLAWSSIAHSGYILMGILAGPHVGGFGAVLVYLLAYGLSNTAAFAALAALRRGGAEVESLKDLPGLREQHGLTAWTMAIASGSLLGFPPLIGFWGKLLLFIAAVASGHIVLVVIAALNSAISAGYYLKLVAIPIMGEPTARSREVERAISPWPRLVGIALAVSLLLMPLVLPVLMQQVQRIFAN
ncbi:MAG: NADH-quinone oxidoreductase subunit N [Phycisphaerales bacterium]|nr:NADH-quinone oxidoreductase subunit N [Phycisphaerales bacterium]